MADLKVAKIEGNSYHSLFLTEDDKELEDMLTEKEYINLSNSGSPKLPNKCKKWIYSWCAVDVDTPSKKMEDFICIEIGNDLFIRVKEDKYDYLKSTEYTITKDKADKISVTPDPPTCTIKNGTIEEKSNGNSTRL